jgi:signal transduction histidine kinase
MAHEVRNPLNSMAIHVDLLEGRLAKETLGPKEREIMARSLAVLQAEIERVDKILEEYLAFAGPSEAARAPVDAAQLIGEAVKRARPEAERRGVGIEVRSDGEMGQWAVDAPALGEAIDALLSNALQASRKGQGIEVTARTSADGEAEVTVADHGDGILAEDLKQIFHIGFSTRGRHGIGLTVAKQIVKGHGGSLNVTSDGRGKGTHAVLRMPLETEADPDALDE